MQGYKFLMEYYEEGDKIYIFGFSRGAFIARFLARMLSQIGLLSKGNEQLLPFAYSNFLGKTCLGLHLHLNLLSHTS
jgi:uncharacterized protein (DUF2235 family)